MAKLTILVLAMFGAWIVFSALPFFSTTITILGTTLTYGAIGLLIVFLLVMKMKTE